MMIDSSLKFLLDLIFVVFKKTFLLWVRVPDKEIFFQHSSLIRCSTIPCTKHCNK